MQKYANKCHFTIKDGYSPVSRLIVQHVWAGKGLHAN